MKNIFIIESPGKIKKIQTILGKDYNIIATYGHILDIIPPTKKNRFSLDEHDQMLIYQIKNTKFVNALKNKIKEGYNNIYIATDDDREGEMIGWSVCKYCNIKDAKRVKYSSITKDEILRGIENYTEIDIDLVFAQQARCAIDRIIGFSISTIIAKNLYYGLSGGRVQSVILKLIHEKEEEIKKHKIKINGEYTSCTFKINNINIKFKSPENINKLNKTYKIKTIGIKKMETFPPLPFITETLQSSLYSSHGYLPSVIMNTCQDLYEKGLITYMRTDCYGMSPSFSKVITKHITDKFGEKYLGTSGIAKSGAHECIRVCNLNIIPKTGSSYSDIIYRAIYDRTLQSHMSSMIYEKYTIHLDDDNFIGTVDKILFPGFKYNIKYENIEIHEGNIAKMIDLETHPDIDTPPQRYTPSSLIKKIGKNGLNIGRPSTYESLIGKVTQRGYTSLRKCDGTLLSYQKKKWKIGDDKITEENVEINVGSCANGYKMTILGNMAMKIITHMPEVINYEYTKNMEEKLDKIAIGEFDRGAVVRNSMKKMSKYDKLKVDTLSDKSSENIILKKGPYGLYYFDTKTKKTLKWNSTYDEKDLDDLINNYPKNLGKYKSSDILIKLGNTGPYLSWNNKNYAINKKSIVGIDDAINHINIYGKCQREYTKHKCRNDGGNEGRNVLWR